MGSILVTGVAHSPSVHCEPREVNAMVRCKNNACKAVKRITGIAWKGYAGYGRYRISYNWPTVSCSCGREYPSITPIEGRLTDEPCSAKCTGAKGHNCECACGGKNHGKSYA